MNHINLLIKPASGLCNLRCRYCFYADEMQNRNTPSYGVMSIATLENIIAKTFALPVSEVTLAFQGGEPTLAGLDFFRKTVGLVQQYNKRRLVVHYAMQTNGVVIDGEWAQFLADNHFLVGLSLDGVKDTHDLYRLDPDGNGSYKTVMHTAQLLKNHRIDYNILTVVTAQVAARIGKIYSFYKNNRFDYQQYIPCLDPLGEERGNHSYSLTPDRYEQFLKSQFDCWYNDMSRGIYVYNRYFENLVGMLLRQPPESCGMIGHCSKQLVIEADGSVYPCDFYVLDSYLLGNLNDNSYEELEHRRDELGFIEASAKVQECCKVCRWYPLCRGGCRRDREQPDGTLGQNYYCSAYRAFFEHSISRLEELAQTAANGGFVKK